MNTTFIPCIKQKYVIWKQAVKAGSYNYIHQEDIKKIAFLSPCAVLWADSKEAALAGLLPMGPQISKQLLDRILGGLYI